MTQVLPLLNAVLNGCASACLISGFIAIRRKRVDVHWKFMLSAFLFSTLFLISYLLRFYLTGLHRFPEDGWVKTLYLTILISHTSLAAITPFLALRTLYLAFKKRYEQHKRIARITFPIWLYVSVTGVVVYWMLYRI